MDTSTKYIIGIVVIIILGIGAYALWGHSGSTPATTGSTASGTDMNDMDMGSSTDMSGGSSGSTTSSGTGVSVGVNASAGTNMPVVTYTDSGFSPSSLTIAAGQTVTFVNKSSGGMWVASDPHPTHQGYDGTTRDQHCAPGYTGAAPFDECSSSASSFTFTFTKVGSWGYHNHLNPGATGTITVTAS